jgi:hypothetical protein
MMDYRLDPLWLKLNMMNAQGMQAFAPMMQMMEQQMGQNSEMAQRVIEEYRKFLFLAMRAGPSGDPARPINDVWMMHMQNAQNYWENLAKMITERPVAGGMDAKTMGNVGDAWAATLNPTRRSSAPSRRWTSGARARRRKTPGSRG